MSQRRDFIDAVANGDLEAQPSELITAAMAAFAWAGLSDEALAILPTALARTRAEHRTTAHGMSLVAAAVVEFHRADPATALAAAQRALDFAGTSGLGAYHGIAPALAIRAAMTPGASAQSDAEQAVALARRATTRLGLVFVLTLAGDVLLRDDGAMLRAGGEDGRALIDEAQRIIETCADPGIALPILERVAARHRVVRPRAVPTNGLVEILSERELAVLRYLLRPEEVGVVTCRGRVWRFGVRVDWACRVLGVRVVQFVSMRAAILTRLWLKMPWPHQVRAPSMPV